MLSKVIWLAVGAGVVRYAMKRQRMRRISVGTASPGLLQSRRAPGYAADAFLPDGGQHSALLPASSGTGVHHIP